MSAPSNPHFATFVTMLIDTLAAMMPGSDGDSKEVRRDIARLMFEAFQPRDAIEAMAAARAVAAHHAAMDNFARAARPGVSDETAMRLRANALAAGRSVEAMLRTRDRRRKELSADESQPPAQQPTVARETPRQPPMPVSPRPDYRASTALTPALQPDPIVALAVEGARSASAQMKRTG